LIADSMIILVWVIIFPGVQIWPTNTDKSCVYQTRWAFKFPSFKSRLKIYLKFKCQKKGEKGKSSWWKRKIVAE
jgi:hypothetical protein